MLWIRGQGLHCELMHLNDICTGSHVMLYYSIHMELFLFHIGCVKGCFRYFHFFC